MSDLEQRLAECFRTVFPNLTADEIARASAVSIPSWDSLATVTLVALIEEEFEVTISPDDYEYLVSFDLVKHCVESRSRHV